MKKIVSVCLVVLLVLLLCCVSACGNARYNAGRKINSINHRGFATAPENTLAAYRISKEKGFSFVECDVSFTKDGVPVLLHDATVNRTSNGHGKIRELTFQEVRLLDFGSWKGAKYKGEKIPSFQEFLQLCVQLQLHPYVEVKGGATEAEVDLLASMVQEIQLSVTWISFDSSALARLAQHFSNGRFGYLVNVVSEENVAQAEALSTAENYVFINCRYSSLLASHIQLCKQNNIPLEVWTVNSKLVIANINTYVSGVTSDSLIAQDIFDNL